MRNHKYSIVGGGMTADAAVSGIRELDNEGSIALINAEFDIPYDRPPLTKGLWKGKPLDSIWRQTKGRSVDLYLGRTVEAVDVEHKTVIDDQKEAYSFDKLLLATGGSPRRLPFGGDDIIYFRTVEDYRRLQTWAAKGRRFAVIGGGFIGSEIAAALAMNAKQVVMVFPGTGRDGKLLVDAGMTASRPGITEALNSLSSDPVTHLINTHWHFDHTDGNEWLHSIGAEITAHENTRKHLSETTRVEAWNFTFPPSPKGASPTKVFARDRRLQLNSANIALDYYGPAHTDSDISINFTGADILHVGNTWWNGYFPFIDYNTGGSINPTIRAAEANLSKTTAKTIVIPGHGPVGDGTGLIEFRDMLVAVRDKVAGLKHQASSSRKLPQPNRPPNSMPNGAGSSSTEKPSRNWFTRACRLNCCGRQNQQAE